MFEVQSMFYFGSDELDSQKFDSEDELERSVEPSEGNN